MKYCIYCGKPIQEGQKFCTYCGKEQRKIVPEESKKTGKRNGRTKTTGRTVKGREDFDDPDDKAVKKNVILIVIIVAAAIAVGGFFAVKTGLLGGLSDSILSWNRADSDEEDVSAEEEAEEEEAIEEEEEEDSEGEEEPELSEIDIDAVTNTYAQFTGTLTDRGDAYVVAVLGSYNIYAYDSTGEKVVMEEVNQIVLSEIDSWDIAGYTGKEVTVGGYLEVSDGDVTMALADFEGPEIEDTAVHTYQIIISDCTWTEAMQQARERGGYLVRINSQEEYDTIIAQLDAGDYSKYHFYLGGRRDSDGTDYYWVDTDNQFLGDCLNSSDSWCRSVWYAGEPSYADGDVEEDAMNLFCVGGTWYLNDSSMDLPGNYPDMLTGKVGYIIEIE